MTLPGLCIATLFIICFLEQCDAHPFALKLKTVDPSLALQVTTAYKCALVLRDLVAPYLLRRYLRLWPFSVHTLRQWWKADLVESLGGAKAN